MNRIFRVALILCTLATSFAHAQVKTTREQILFYTADWKGERFPDGRPKLPDSLLTRALDVSLEDVWDFLREHKYNNQFEGNWQSLHPDQPFAGRALTAQYMPSRPDMTKAIDASGDWNDQIESIFKKAIEEFKKTGSW